jgi:signal transduction histidine kinase
MPDYNRKWTGNNNFEDRFYYVSKICAWLTIVTGVLVLLGWIFDVDMLKSPRADMITIKANTAVTLILAGVSLVLVVRKNPDTLACRAGMFLAFVVVLLGALNLCEYLFTFDAGIDQLLFRDPIGAVGTVNPGRMAPNTAVNFIFIGISIMLLNIKSDFLFNTGRFLILIQGLVTLFAMTGYLYGVRQFYGIQSYSKMAFYTTLGFAFAFLGAIFARPDKGVIAELSADNPGGTLLRYLAPAIIVILFVLGWFRIFGEKSGIYESYFGTALFTVIRIVIFLVIGWAIARYMNKFYELRREKEIALQLAESKYDAIKETDRLKTQFIAVVSHELRTPITIIKGSVALLSREDYGILNTKQRDFAAMIEANTGRLKLIVDDMVDISRIESGSFTIEKTPVNINALIDSCINEMEQISLKNNIRLTKDIGIEDLILTVDKGRMEQVMTNLTSNAIKFSKPGLEIRIGLKCADPVNMPLKIKETLDKARNYVVFYVEDHGIGIEEQNINRVFERFFQVEEHTVRKKQGMGLGLNIVKNIIEAHGGAVWCESAGLGLGSTFFTVLPDE